MHFFLWFVYNFETVPLKLEKHSLQLWWDFVQQVDESVILLFSCFPLDKNVIDDDNTVQTFDHHVCDCPLQHLRGWLYPKWKTKQPASPTGHFGAFLSDLICQKP
ncbi:hypothetical protein MHYP_G00222440 [Metynnis hypsauchen]